MADSKPPPNGKTLSIAAVVSVLVLGGMFAGGALFVVQRSDDAQERAVVRCRAMVESERRANGDRYASALAVSRLEAKMDAVSDGVTELRSEVRELRQETREAIRGRPRPRSSLGGASSRETP
jgi:hypothetical protein